MDCRITFFTPTYNRGNLLPNLYESLINQTNKNFIWMIVDDGSIDNTRVLVDKWRQENKISIEYIYKQNGGKNSAMEVAFANCKTEYVCIVDSDDALSVDATEIVYKYIPYCDNSIAGMVCRRAHYNLEPFNNSWPQNSQKLYFRELAENYNYTQDTCLIFKTNIVKNYHFPKIEGEKFITESVFYNQFMSDYKMLAIVECVYLAEYQEDGYTSQGLNLFFKNPKGYLYALKQNFYYSLINKSGIKSVVYHLAYFYAWKSVMKIKDEFKSDYRIRFPFNFVGWCSQVFIKSKLKRKYRQFLENQKGGK